MFRSRVGTKEQHCKVCSYPFMVAWSVWLESAAIAVLGAALVWWGTRRTSLRATAPVQERFTKPVRVGGAIHRARSAGTVVLEGTRSSGLSNGERSTRDQQAVQETRCVLWREGEMERL